LTVTLGGKTAFALLGGGWLVVSALVLLLRAVNPNLFKLNLETLVEPRRHVKPPNFPYPTITVPGAEAFETWRKLCNEPGVTPVVIGSDADLQSLAREIAEKRRKLPRILRDASKISFPDDFMAGRFDDPDEPLPIGKWPPASEAPVVAFDPPVFAACETNLTQRFLDRVHIALVPTSDPTEAPALLGFGGFNGSPEPEMHVAALRRWRDEYGARILACTHDTIEVRVERGPATRKAAIELAKVHYAYACFDVNDYSEIASELMREGPATWLFWWD
jgi:hypothetical protein